MRLLKPCSQLASTQSSYLKYVGACQDACAGKDSHASSVAVPLSKAISHEDCSNTLIAPRYLFILAWDFCLAAPQHFLVTDSSSGLVIKLF